MPDEKKDPEFLITGIHGINTYQKCPKCGGTNFEVRNYNRLWQDGEVWCKSCNVYVREYDAG